MTRFLTSYLAAAVVFVALDAIWLHTMKVAVIGTGIAGNVVAHRLHGAGHEITVFEADARAGGHTHTHCIEVDGEAHAIDTGFIVFNDRTYPHFIALLDELGVDSQPTSMSFSVRNDRRGLEYNGTSLDGLFAQRRNLVRPSFLAMLAAILRFHRRAPALLAQDAPDVTLGEYLEEHGFRGRFVDDYLVPMGASIWSTDPERMMPGSANVHEPGLSGVAPGSGVMRWPPVSVCHHVSTIGHFDPPTVS